MDERTDWPGDGPDEEVVRALRGIYASPAGEVYWDGLEARIMGRVADDRGSLWPLVASWAPAGIIAAAAALLMAGLALHRINTEEASVAYEAAVRGAAPMAVRTVSAAPGTSVREATFEYVITH